MSWPFIFANLNGNVPAANLDANFAVAAFASDVTALQATVSALPSSSVPLIPVAGGAAGASSTLSRSDHQHPPQAATKTTVAGTSYTVSANDNGCVIRFTSSSAVTVTVPNNLAADFSCLLSQNGTGQVSFTAASGATQQQRQGFTKTAGQFAVVSLLGDSNSGGTSFVYILSGDMSA